MHPHAHASDLQDRDSHSEEDMRCQWPVSDPQARRKIDCTCREQAGLHCATNSYVAVIMEEQLNDHDTHNVEPLVYSAQG